jgi:acetoin utilization protein AcuB
MTKTKTIAQLMTKHPLTIGYEEAIQKASEVMLEHRFRHLPVIDQIGEVIGILSDRDIQRAMEVRRHGIETETVIASHRKVKDFMSWPAHTVGDHTPLKNVLSLMINEKISAVLVSAELTSKVRGIITSEDLLKEFERLLNEDEGEDVIPVIPGGKDPANIFRD